MSIDRKSVPARLSHFSVVVDRRSRAAECHLVKPLHLILTDFPSKLSVTAVWRGGVEGSPRAEWARAHLEWFLSYWKECFLTAVYVLKSNWCNYKRHLFHTSEICTMFAKNRSNAFQSLRKCLWCVSPASFCGIGNLALLSCRSAIFVDL